MSTLDPATSSRHIATRRAAAGADTCHRSRCTAALSSISVLIRSGCRQIGAVVFFHYVRFPVVVANVGRNNGQKDTPAGLRAGVTAQKPHHLFDVRDERTRS